MSLPVLTPTQNSNLSVLPATGTIANVVPALPLGIYSTSTAFLSGAVDQVAFTYAMMGGPVLDLEITEGMVYTAYEAAVAEYSYLVNLHQAKNALGSFLGSTTGSFNQDGTITAGTLSGTTASLKFPKFSLAYARSISDEIAYESGMGGNVPFYSGSIDIIANVQDYDLQTAVLNAASSSATLTAALSSSNNGQIRVNKVYYKSPGQTWRFFGYYGGLSVVGNLHSYGQYADDSTFDIIPAWQNILQSINYETNLKVRTSHYSYEIRNNKIRLFPVPQPGGPTKVWFIFSWAPNPLEEDVNSKTGVNGVNNLNTLPFENIPYESINSIGKQWVRRYCLAITKGMLSQTRGKFEVLPIPGESVTLNHATLLSQSTEEMEALREELKEIMSELTYNKVMEDQSNMVEMNSKIHSHIPRLIYVG